MASFLGNLVNKITGTNATDSAASANNASNTLAIQLPTEPSEAKTNTQEMDRSRIENEIQKFATSLGLNSEQKANLVYSGSNAAVANGGSIDTSALKNETAKVTGIDPNILAQAMAAGRGAQVSGMTSADHNSVQVAAGAGQQRGGSALGIA